MDGDAHEQPFGARPRLSLLAIALAGASLALMGNSGGRASVGNEGNTGAPGEPARLCLNCHNSGNYGPIITLVEITTLGGQLVASYTPGQTYNVKVTVAANAGNPSGYGFQLTSIKGNGQSTGTWQNLGANVKTAVPTNPAGRTYIEHKGGASAANIFTARWVAPAANTGSVDFHYSAAVVDGNNAKTGDNTDLGSSITLLELGPGGLPFFDDFEFGPGGWQSYPEPGALGAPSWEHGIPMGAAIWSAWSGDNAWVTNLGGNYKHDEISYLESPPRDFSVSTGDAVIDFAVQYDTETGADGGWLELSTDGGTSWDKVGDGSSGSGWYNGFSATYGPLWDGDSGGWLMASHPLPGTAGMADVRVRFAFVSNSSIAYEGIAIDDVQLSVPDADDGPPCDPDYPDPECDDLDASPCESPESPECEPADAGPGDAGPGDAGSCDGHDAGPECDPLGE